MAQGIDIGAQRLAMRSQRFRFQLDALLVESLQIFEFAHREADSHFVRFPFVLDDLGKYLVAFR